MRRFACLPPSMSKRTIRRPDEGTSRAGRRRHCDRAAVEQNLRMSNADWSGENAEFTSWIVVSVRSLYCTQLSGCPISKFMDILKSVPVVSCIGSARRPAPHPPHLSIQATIYTVSPKTSTSYFSNNCQKLTNFNDFRHVKSWKIWHENLTDLSTSPVRCSYITLGNPKKSFSTVVFIHISDYFSEENKL